ncbi:hypothetical protein [Pseudalkalibacillus decolorationis]|uniref:hypothetical protein n=1 Tax=Pseudalkalibacillus decolorationis TaxID=163879 RepID=UPI002148BCDB|nr:hypothetical protein [Pseudalkalibacillus decolorationis]
MKIHTFFQKIIRKAEAPCLGATSAGDSATEHALCVCERIEATSSTWALELDIVRKVEAPCLGATSAGDSATEHALCVCERIEVTSSTWAQELDIVRKAEAPCLGAIKKTWPAPSSAKAVALVALMLESASAGDSATEHALCVCERIEATSSTWAQELDIIRKAENVPP